MPQELKAEESAGTCATLLDLSAMFLTAPFNSAATLADVQARASRDSGALVGLESLLFYVTIQIKSERSPVSSSLFSAVIEREALHREKHQSPPRRSVAIS